MSVHLDESESLMSDDSVRYYLFTKSYQSLPNYEATGKPLIVVVMYTYEGGLK